MLQAIAAHSVLVMLALVFIAVVLLLQGLFMIWRSYRGPEAVRLHKRLRMLSASRDSSGQTQLLKQRMLSELPALERTLRSLPSVHSLDGFIQQAGLDWTVSKLLLVCAMLGVVGWAGLTLTYPSQLVALMAGAVLATLPGLYVQYRRGKRLARLEQQLPEALDLIARALRSGHAFSSSVQMAGEELAEPLAAEFRIVHDEINFGVSMQQALTHLSERVPLTDLRYFVVAVLVQRDSGGNLTEILSNLSRLIRERLKLLAKVRVLSSESRLSAWILGLMPFAMAALMTALNPAFMRPLWTDPLGVAIIKTLLVLMAIGILALRKIVKIRI